MKLTTSFIIILLFCSHVTVIHFSVAYRATDGCVWKQNGIWLFSRIYFYLYKAVYTIKFSRVMLTLSRQIRHLW